MMISTIASDGPLHAKYVSNFITMVGSSTYDVANSAAQLLPTLDAAMGNNLDPKAGFDILLNATQAAEWGAWSTQAALASKFSNAPNLRSKVRAYLNSFPGDAAASFASKSPQVNFATWSAMF